MRLSPKFLTRLAIFTIVMAIFAAIEWKLRSEYTSPDHAIPGRHQILPDIAVDQKIFKFYAGSAEVEVPLEVKNLDLNHLQGIRFRTGTNDKSNLSAEVSVKDARGETICTASDSILLKENRWTSVLLRCSPRGKPADGPLFLHVAVVDLAPWAIFAAKNGAPAIQFWLDDPTFKASFFEARNYGNLWNPYVLSAFRIMARVCIAIGLVFLIVPGATSRRKIYFGLLIWCGVFWGQFCETVSYHNPDETMHVAGAYREVVPHTSWQDVFYGSLLRVGGAVQLHETYAKAENPIVSGSIGQNWVSDNNYFVQPEARSGIYDGLVRPMVPITLALAAKFSGICSDPVIYFRALIGGLLTAIMVATCFFYSKLRRPNSVWIMFIMTMVPAVLTSLLTVWNYGFLTFLGFLFSVNLLPEGENKSAETPIILSALLIPILGEFARSQIMWFVIGPFAVTVAMVFVTSGNSSQKRRVRGLLRAACGSFAVYFLLAGLLGETFIPDRGMLAGLITRWSDFFRIPGNMMGLSNIPALAVLQLMVWILSSVTMIALDEALRRLSRLVRGQWVQALKLAGSLVFVVVLAVTFRKCWSIEKPEFLESLAALNPYPTFGEHFKLAYRALMSQSFGRIQDYFLVQTFFMAYGWLEVTGHWSVYFIYRHLMELGLLAVLVTGITRFRAFAQFYLPLSAAFLMYFYGIWQGAWYGHFTIVGRFMFPAMGLLWLPMMVAAGGFFSGSTKGAQIPLNSKIFQMIFFYCLINAIYGAFYVLPLRFTVGLQ